MDRLLRLFDHAVAKGRLLYYTSSVEHVEVNGLAFEKRYCPGLKDKPKNRADGSNPFLPYDPDLFIEDIGRDHALLFNKFSVVRPHILLVCKTFKPQNSDLDGTDFAAIKMFFDKYGKDWLMFYNCGPLSGASQPHRHFQFVPLWRNARPAVGTMRQCSMSSLEDHYAQSDKSESFNFLATPEWMVLINRSAERCSLGISLNSLAMMGCFLVKSQHELDLLAAADLPSLIDQVTRS